MKLIIVGCEYAGATTLASKLHEWSHEHMDKGFPIVHDHWKVPHVWGHPAGTTQLKGMTPDERRQVMALSPRLKEASQRQSLFYHIFPPDHEDDAGVVDGDLLEIQAVVGAIQSALRAT